MEGPAPSRQEPPRSVPPGPKEPHLGRLIAGACVSAFLMLMLMVQAVRHGWLPKTIIANIEGSAGIPDTTNPETMAQGAIPVSTVACAFTRNFPGGTCVLEFLDQRGDLVWPSLDVPVPRTWLQAQPHPTAANNGALLAALVDSPYSPANTAELDGLPVSVEPAFGHVLEGAGVTPAAFLSWLYRNVPDIHRPPWVRGGVNPASNTDY